ncbi:MAG: flagellar basal body P-ring formation chaperone FlgA, partial [Pseudomonadota bacterium]
ADIEWVEHVQTPGSIVLVRGTENPVGRVLRTTAGAGQMLSSAMLEPAWLIRRGERVTLAAGQRGLAIRMQGIALADGALGQKIRARNAESGNTVEGVVRDRGLLEIVFY